MISSYTTGQIGFLLCEKYPAVASSIEDITNRWNKIQSTKNGTSYYQPRLQQSSFDLPLWVEKAVYFEGDGLHDEL
jgi:hypothetical protein